MKEIDLHSSIHERATLTVLQALSRSETLLNDYVLKGGYTLFHIFGSPRRSYDLDFSLAQPFSREVTSEKNELLQAFCELLETELAVAAKEGGFAVMQVHWREFSIELPALLGRIGYALEPTQEADFRWYVETQVTLSEVICETTLACIGDIPVHIPVLEDILADKLKALIQQVVRDVSRPNDLYDLWYFTTHPPRPLDLKKIKAYTEAKSEAISPPLSITAAGFRNPGVKAHASEGYDGIRDELTDASLFVSADEAYSALLTFVDQLGLPER